MRLADHLENSDLTEAIEYNINEYWHYEDDKLAADTDIITAIYGEIEGEPDGATYHWLVGFNNGDVAYITGSCDYTGWSCQSRARITRFTQKDKIVVPLWDDYNRSPANEWEDIIRFLNETRLSDKQAV
jgi:hypothetical protein